MSLRHGSLGTILGKGVARLLAHLPSSAIQSLIIRTAVYCAQRGDAASGLRFLFNLEAAIYPIEGDLAITYGGGLHTKHRHTRYHNFFIDRVGTAKTVLDIGCGNGALAYDIAQNTGAQVNGIDFSEDNIAKAKQHYNHANVIYQVGDALSDLPQHQFDLVILSNVLEHLPNRPIFLKNIQTQLHPKRVLIRVPLFERDWRVPLKQELGLEWRLDPTHETEYTLENFAQEISEAGMTVTYQDVRWGEIWAEVSSCVSA